MRSIRRTRGGPLLRIRAAWANVAGPVISARTRVAGVDGGVIRVDVASAALKHDLATFRRKELLGARRKELPDTAIREVRYRIGRVS